MTPSWQMETTLFSSLTTMMTASVSSLRPRAARWRRPRLRSRSMRWVMEDAGSGEDSVRAQDKAAVVERGFFVEEGED